MRGLEEHRERLAAWLAPQVVRPPEEERLVVQYRTRRLAHALLEIVAERLLPFQMPRDIVEHRFEALRRIIAVETRHHLSFFVEKEERRRELHVEHACELLLGHDATIEPRHFAVAPHVYCERDKVLARFLHDAALGEIGHHELLAVGAAILTEIHEQPPAVARCLRNVLAQIEEGIRKPRWNIDC